MHLARSQAKKSTAKSLKWLQKICRERHPEMKNERLQASDLTARLWPEAGGLAWLRKALAHRNREPGQGRQPRLALAWLWPEPRPEAG